MKHNYIDGKGVYHNELNLTLAQIYDSGVEFGHSVAKEEFVKELEKLKAEVHDIRLEIDCDMHTGDKVIQLIDKRISELKGEQE